MEQVLKAKMEKRENNSRYSRIESERRRRRGCRSCGCGCGSGGCGEDGDVGECIVKFNLVEFDLLDGR